MRFAVTAVAVACLFAAGGSAGQLSNRRAPGFSLPDLNLNQHDLADYRGRVVILEFIQTACPVCGSFQRIVQKVNLQFGNKVAVISIVNPPDNQSTVAQFMANFSVKTPVLFDCGQVTASYLKVTPKNPTVHFPHLFLIDGKGTIRNDYGYGGGTEHIFETLDPLLKEVGSLVKELGGTPAPKAPAKKLPITKSE